MRPYFYLGDDRGLTQLSEGQPFYVYTKDRSITPWILLGGIWETFVDDVLCALIRPGDLFIDVGANQGYYTVKVGTRLGPEGRVIAFEPNPGMFRFLADNVELNALQPRATVVAAAAGSAAGKAVMVVPENYPGGGRVLLPHGDHTTLSPIEIDVVRIDDVVTGELTADLVKIDVEGFEPLALEGMQGLLARSPDCAIVCEVCVDLWRRFGDPAEMVRRLAGDRRLFRIQVDGVLDELTEDFLSALDPSFVSYVLMLPKTAERYAQIRHLVRGEAVLAAPVSGD